jgi:4'-phosphopantetheinyl transferase
MEEITIRDSEIQLWWASLAVSDSELERLRTMLSPDELQRADRFQIATAARRFVAARAALRTVLSRATDRDPKDVEFRFGEHGKPRLATPGPLFNASDSGDFVVIALAVVEVGVDIELLRSLRHAERLARRICTDRERRVLERLTEEERDALLLRLWTCKEAALKAVGIGLPGGARNVEVEISSNGQPRMRSLPGTDDEWSLLSPTLHPSLICSTVVRGSGWRTIRRRFAIQSR